jgi:enamine deaminase RidA (YjgF/YER057c/UK114 family)
MSTNQIVAYSPPTVWQVPETFKSVYSHAVEVRDVKRLLIISGQFGVAPDGRLATDFASQCEQAIDNVEALLTASEMTASNIAKLTYYVTSASNFSELVAIRQKRWAREPAPAVTAIVVSGLARPEYLVEIEAMAVSSDEQ